MPRENSFSDEGRSLTPSFSDREDEEEEHGIIRSPVSPRDATRPKVDTTTNGQSAVHTSAERTRTTSNVARSPNTEEKSRHHLFHPHLHRPTHVSIKQYASPKERFRAVGHKVIAMRRASFHIMGSAIGAEPGVDVRRDTAAQLYAGVRARCVIEVVDYSALRTSFVTMGNADLVRWAEDDTKSKRPAWAKVRWINVAGISFDVISALALKYDMHPLALEDLLHQRAQARSKADYYSQHMFLRVLTHTLGDGSEEAVPATNMSSKTPTWSSGTTLTNLPRSSSPEPIDNEKPEDDVREEDRPEYDGSVDPYADAEAGDAPSMRRGSTSSFASRTRKVEANVATLAQLKAADRVDVRLAPLSVFMYPDGTVITFHPGADLSFTAPITARVRQRDTTLRRTGDASLLLQSLLDLVVDRTLEVTEEYHRRIQRLERIVLIKPKVTTVRALHVLSGDLILHKRTMGPIKTLVYGLRRYDADRCAAVMSLGPGEKFSYMTPKANVYLADVHDHMEYALASLDMYADMTENLIGYTFNMAGYDMNNVMRSLTLVTVIFFPLTLLTGYFGMNFEAMWSVNKHTDLLFWEIAIPVLVVCIPLFLWGDIMRVAHYMKKKWMARTIQKNVARDGKWRKMA